jgi:hypothetical protein
VARPLPGWSGRLPVRAAALAQGGPPRLDREGSGGFAQGCVPVWGRDLSPEELHDLQSPVPGKALIRFLARMLA